MTKIDTNNQEVTELRTTHRQAAIRLRNEITLHGPRATLRALIDEYSRSEVEKIFEEVRFETGEDGQSND